MSEQASVDSLIEGYLAAWSEADAARRRELLEAVWETDGVYSDPQSFAPGLDALHATIGGFLASSPGAAFSLNGSIDQHHDSLRFYWTLRMGGQEIAGMDYGEVSPVGKLRKIVGFF